MCGREKERERLAPCLTINMHSLTIILMQVGRVQVHAGDEPSALAENFCRTPPTSTPYTLSRKNGRVAIYSGAFTTGADVFVVSN